MVYPWSFAQSTGRKNGKKQKYGQHPRWFRLADTHELLTAIANASSDGSLLPAAGSVPNASTARSYVPMQPYDTSSGGDRAPSPGPDVPHSMTPVHSLSPAPNEHRTPMPAPAGPGSNERAAVLQMAPMPLGSPLQQQPQQYPSQHPQPHQQMSQQHPLVQQWAPLGQHGMGPAQIQRPSPYSGAAPPPPQIATGMHLYSGPATGSMYDMAPVDFGAEYPPYGMSPATGSMYGMGAAAVGAEHPSYGMSPAAAAAAVAAIEFGPGALVVPLEHAHLQHQPVGLLPRPPSLPPPLPPPPPLPLAPPVQMSTGMGIPNDGLIMYDNSVMYYDVAPQPDMSGVTSMQQWLLMVPDDAKAALARTWSLTAQRATNAASKAPPQPAILPDEYELHGDPRSLTDLLQPLQSGPEAVRHVTAAGGHVTAQSPELVVQYTNQLYGERWDEPAVQPAPGGIRLVLPYAAAQSIGPAGAAADGVGNGSWLYGVYGSNELPHYGPVATASNAPVPVNPSLTQIPRTPELSGQPPVLHPYGSSGGDVIIPTGAVRGVTTQAWSSVSAVPNLYDMYSKWVGPMNSTGGSALATLPSTVPTPPAAPSVRQTPPAALSVRQAQPTRLLYPADLMRQAIADSDGAKVRPARQYPPPLDLRYLPSAILWEVRQAIRQAVAAADHLPASPSATIITDADAAAAFQPPTIHGGRQNVASCPHVPAPSSNITSARAPRKVLIATSAMNTTTTTAGGGGGAGGDGGGDSGGVGALSDTVMRGQLGQGPEESWWLMGSRKPDKRRMESPLDPVFVVDLESREVTVTYKRGGGGGKTEAETQTAGRRNAAVSSSHSSGSDGGTGSAADGDSSSSEYDSDYDSRTRRVVSDSGRSADGGMRTNGRGFRRLMNTMNVMKWWGRRGRRRSGDASRTAGSISHRRRKHQHGDGKEGSEASGPSSRASSHVGGHDGDDDGGNGSGGKEGSRRRRKGAARGTEAGRGKLEGAHGSTKRKVRGSSRGGGDKRGAGGGRLGAQEEEEEEEQSREDASRSDVAETEKRQTKTQERGSDSDTEWSAPNGHRKKTEGKKEKEKKKEKAKGSDEMVGKATGNKKKEKKGEAGRSANAVRAKAGQRRSAAGDGDEARSSDGETEGSEAEKDKEESERGPSGGREDSDSAAAEKHRKRKKPTDQASEEKRPKKLGGKKAVSNKSLKVASGSRWWNWALRNRRRSGAGAGKEQPVDHGQDTEDEAEQEESEEDRQREQGGVKEKPQAEAEVAKSKAKAKAKAANRAKLRVRNVWRRMLHRPALPSPTPSMDSQQAGKDKTPGDKREEETEPEEEDDDEEEEEEDKNPSAAGGTGGTPVTHKSKTAQLARTLKFWRRGSKSDLLERVEKSDKDMKAGNKSKKGREQKKKKPKEYGKGKQGTSVEAMGEEGNKTDDEDEDGIEEEEGADTATRAVEQAETAAESTAKPGQKLPKDAKAVKEKKEGKKAAKKEAKEKDATGKQQGKGAAGTPAAAAATADHTDESDAEDKPEEAEQEAEDREEVHGGTSPLAVKSRRGKWLHAMRAAAFKSTQLWSPGKADTDTKAGKSGKLKPDAKESKDKESGSEDASSRGSGGRGSNNTGMVPIGKSKGNHKIVVGGGLLPKVLGGRKRGGKTAPSGTAAGKAAESGGEHGGGAESDEQDDEEVEEEPRQQQVVKRTSSETGSKKSRKQGRWTDDGSSKGLAAVTTTTPASRASTPPGSPTAAARGAKSPKSPKTSPVRSATASLNTRLGGAPSSTPIITEIEAMEGEGGPTPAGATEGNSGMEGGKKGLSKIKKQGKRASKIATRKSAPVLDALPAPPQEGPKAKLMQNLYKLYVASTTSASTSVPAEAATTLITAEPPKTTSSAIADVDRSGSESPSRRKVAPGSPQRQQQGIKAEDSGVSEASSSRSNLVVTKRSALARLKDTLARGRQRTSPSPSPNATIVRVGSHSSGGREGERGSGGGSGGGGQEAGSGPASPYTNSKHGVMERMMASLRGHKRVADVQEVVNFEEVAEPRGFGETSGRMGALHSTNQHSKLAPSSPPTSRAWSVAPASPTTTTPAAAAAGSPPATSAAGRPPLISRGPQQGSGGPQAVTSPPRSTSRLSATTRSDLGPGSGPAGYQTRGENLMDSIRSRRTSGDGADERVERIHSSSGGTGAADKLGGTAGSNSGGWAQVQATVSVPASPPSPLNRSLLRSALNKTATLVKGQEVGSPGGSIRAHSPLASTVASEAEEGAGRGPVRGGGVGGAWGNHDRSGPGSAASMAAHLADLGLPPSNW